MKKEEAINLINRKYDEHGGDIEFIVLPVPMDYIRKVIEKRNIDMTPEAVMDLVMKVYNDIDVDNSPWGEDLALLAGWDTPKKKTI